MSPVPQKPTSPLVVAFFLGLATCTQVLLALYGLLSRYAQVVSSPPVPALRLVVVVNLIGEAFLLCFHVAPLLLAAQVRRWRQRRQPRPGLPTHAQQVIPGDTKAAETCSSSSEQESQAEEQPSSVEEGLQQAAAGPPDSRHPSLRRESASSEWDNNNQQQQQQSAADKPALVASKSTVRPPVPLVRGLSNKFERWEKERPRLRRTLALAAITVTFMGCCSLQVLAPGFVDVSLVMLTTQWTTLGIALAQALLLRNRLPRAFWPCAVVMLGGAAMVIAPAVSQSTSGSLNTARGWWGFAMAIGALLSTVTYYTLLQACRHMGFKALHLQHCMNLLSILFYLPLSLPIDGANWSAQFRGWTATDWVALMALSTAAYLGSGTFMQLCVWKLGAPTAAMFFGLRLVFSVVLSTPILGTTVIQTGVQIAGVVLTAVAVTAYAASQWWASREEQRNQQLMASEQGRQEQADAGSRQAPPVASCCHAGAA